ncbi:hypothetical protein ABW19_dt0207365 [Dactylella cylindrospora]|nr:hypothetical protein ABW19_dt0207365 [Dactylella cylindrospora]
MAFAIPYYRNAITITLLLLYRSHLLRPFNQKRKGVPSLDSNKNLGRYPSSSTAQKNYQLVRLAKLLCRPAFSVTRKKGCLQKCIFLGSKSIPFGLNKDGVLHICTAKRWGEREKVWKG